MVGRIKCYDAAHAAITGSTHLTNDLDRTTKLLGSGCQVQSMKIVMISAITRIFGSTHQINESRDRIDYRCTGNADLRADIVVRTIRWVSVPSDNADILH